MLGPKATQLPIKTRKNRVLKSDAAGVPWDREEVKKRKV